MFGAMADDRMGILSGRRALVGIAQYRHAVLFSGPVLLCPRNHRNPSPSLDISYCSRATVFEPPRVIFVAILEDIKSADG